jgi:hypothetical protein
VFVVFMAKRARWAAARRINTLKIPVSVRLSDCVLLSLTLLLLRCGDIESNPGPSMEDLIKDLGHKLSRQIGDVSSEMKFLSSKLEDIQEQFWHKEHDINDMKMTTELLKSKTDTIGERLEKQDIMMRKDNIIVYGLEEGGGGVAGVETEEKLVDTLVSVFRQCDTRQWSEVDFASAHRIGKPGSQKKRPVVARLVMSRVKRSAIGSRHLRQALKKKGVKIDDDLTDQQRLTLKEWRDDGFIAFYRGTRLYTKKRSEPTRHSAMQSGGDVGAGGYDDDDSDVGARRSSLQCTAEAVRRRSADESTPPSTSSHPSENRRYSSGYQPFPPNPFTSSHPSENGRYSSGNQPFPRSLSPFTSSHPSENRRYSSGNEPSPPNPLPNHREVIPIWDGARPSPINSPSPPTGDVTADTPMGVGGINMPGGGTAADSAAASSVAHCAVVTRADNDAVDEPSSSSSAAAAQLSGRHPGDPVTSRSSDAAVPGVSTLGSAPGKSAKQPGAARDASRRSSLHTRPQPQVQTSSRATRARSSRQSTLDSGWRHGNSR